MKSENVHAKWQQAQHVREFLREYLRDKSQRTQWKYERVLREFIQFCCARYECDPQDLDLSSCTQVKIEDYVFYEQIGRNVIEEFLETKTCQSQQNDALTVLRAYFRYLLEYDVVQMIPVPKPAKPNPRKPKLGLSEDAIHRLAMMFMQSSHPCRYALMLQMSGGLRVGELCALRVGDVIQTSGGNWEVSICREALKGRRSRRIPLPDVSPFMNEWMRWRVEHQIRSEYLFVTRRGTKMSYIQLYQFMKQLAQSAGLPRTIATHDLRRAYATIVDKYIKNPDALSQALGHVTNTWAGGVVTRRYVREPELDEVSYWVARLPVTGLAESLAIQWHALKDVCHTCTNEET